MYSEYIFTCPSGDGLVVFINNLILIDRITKLINGKKKLF